MTEFTDDERVILIEFLNVLRTQGWYCPEPAPLKDVVSLLDVSDYSLHECVMVIHRFAEMDNTPVVTGTVQDTLVVCLNGRSVDDCEQNANEWIEKLR